MKKINIAQLLILVMALTWSTGTAYAVETFADIVNAVTFKSERVDLAHEHGLVIKPYLKQGFAYSSNVFKASDIPGAGEHDAVTWTITPGVDIKHYGDYGNAGVSYEATFKYLNRFGEANTQDQDFLTFANLKTSENTYLKISNRLTQKGSMPGSPAFENVNYLDNRFKATMGFNAENGQTYELSYENYDHDFQENIASRYSYNENIYSFRLYQPLNDTTRIYSGFMLGEIEFDVLSSRDTTYWEFPIGVEGELLYGWLGHAGVGLHHRNRHAEGRNDLTHVVTNIGMKKTFYFFGREASSYHDPNGYIMPTEGGDSGDWRSPPTTISLGFIRRDIESTFSTATTYDQKLWHGNLQHLFTKKLRGRASIYMGNNDFEDRVFTGARIVVAGAVFATTPNQVKRDDQVFGWGAGFDYNVCENLIMHFDYNYSRRESNVSGLDYTDHSLSVKSTMPF